MPTYFNFVVRIFFLLPTSIIKKNSIEAKKIYKKSKVGLPTLFLKGKMQGASYQFGVALMLLTSQSREHSEQTHGSKT